MDNKTLLDKAFREAGKQSKISKGKEKKDKYIKADITRIETSRNVVFGYLTGLLTEYKELKEMDLFRLELLKTTVDWEKVKRELRQIVESLKIIDRLTRQYVVKIKYMEDKRKTNLMRKEYYGRFSSVVKKLKYDELLQFIKMRKKLPHIKNMKTIILAGYPNVGKSMILKQISGNDIETQPYPFTTKRILIGHAKMGYEDIQIIDTPGILDRDTSEMNQIEKRAMIALKYLSQDVIFVIDPSENCGFPLEKQLKLMKTIKKNFDPNMIVVATHMDVDHKKVKADISINALSEEDIKRLKSFVLKYYYNWKR